MRNVTISLNDDVARWARVWAAEHDTSLSSLLGRKLEEMMEQEQLRDEARLRFVSKPAVPLSQGEAYPPRDTLYDR